MALLYILIRLVQLYFFLVLCYWRLTETGVWHQQHTLGRDSLFASFQSLFSESRFSPGRALIACSVLVRRDASNAAETPTAPRTTMPERSGLTAPPLCQWRDFEAVETFSHLPALRKTPREGSALILADPLPSLQSAWKERCASLLMKLRWLGHLFSVPDMNPTLLESETRAASFDIWNTMVWSVLTVDSWQI